METTISELIEQLQDAVMATRRTSRELAMSRAGAEVRAAIEADNESLKAVLDLVDQLRTSTRDI